MFAPRCIIICLNHINSFFAPNVSQFMFFCIVIIPVCTMVGIEMQNLYERGHMSSYHPKWKRWHGASSRTISSRVMRLGLWISSPLGADTAKCLNQNLKKWLRWVAFVTYSANSCFQSYKDQGQVDSDVFLLRFFVPFFFTSLTL